MTRDDLPRALAFWNDVEVELASGGDPPMPHTMEGMEAQYEQFQKAFANFAIEADGSFIGSCALFNADATSAVCELGIIIGDRAYWGRGYGREAVSLLLDYAFRLRNVHKVWLRVTAGNERAIRSYRACGFVEEGRQRQQFWSDGSYHDLVFMGLLREEWRGLARPGAAAE